MPVSSRRQLDFRTFDELSADVARLRENGYDRAGQWSLEQALDHLALTMDAMQDGKPGMPRPVRWVLRPLLRRMIRTRSMPKVPAPKKMRPPPAVDDGIHERFAAAIAQAVAMTGTVIDHPILGRISVKEWQQLQLIHAARHLSFLIPRTHQRTHPPTH